MTAFKIDPKGFFVGTPPRSHFDEALAEALQGLLASCSVVDLGCGQGRYVSSLRDRGIPCAGFDGNPLTTADCGQADLSVPQGLGLWDCVLSLEVGEHIPAEYEDVFLENLDRHNRRGIIMSWAIPGQGGHGHVNEQENNYIIEKVVALGYKYLPNTAQRLRSIATKRWFKNTIMVFEQEAILDSLFSQDLLQ
jgi:hypothetical protein